MFTECRLLYEELNAFSRIVIKAQCVMIVSKVVSIRQTIVTNFPRFRRVDAQCKGHFIPCFE